jgi:hypothetical protein
MVRTAPRDAVPATSPNEETDMYGKENRKARLPALALAGALALASTVGVERAFRYEGSTPGVEAPMAAKATLQPPPMRDLVPPRINVIAVRPAGRNAG